MTGPETGGTPESRPNRPWSLRRRLTALCLLVAVVMAFLATGAGVTAVSNNGQLDNLLTNIGPMRTASTNLLAALVDQETALRGYVLTGSAKDIAPYDAAMTAQSKESATIAGSPAATPEVRREVDRVTAAADVWRATVATPAIAAVSRGDQSTAGQLIDDRARDRFNDVRTAVAVLQNTLQKIRDDAVASIQDNSSTLLFVLIAVAILGISAAAGLLIALQRTVIGPITNLAGQVRSVAGGDYGLEISTAGPPELENLAQDVNRMRRQIVTDLAEVEAARRQIEETARLLEQQAAELTRSNRDLEQFAYVASHDLQEPLRKVTSFCQLLQRRYAGQLDERADQYIAFAVSGAQRMQRLINDLLAFSRIGRVTTGFTDVDLGAAVEEAVTARIDLGVLPDGQPTTGARPEVVWSDLPVVRGEEALLVTLFANLIGNSVKFHRPGTTPRVEISARERGDAWEISCVDNGIGIEPEYAEKVFVIFQRLHPRDAYPGTGIGLSVAKKIVEYHGGQIWIDTSYTAGTAIRFTLPIEVEPGAEPSVSVLLSANAGP